MGGDDKMAQTGYDARYQIGYGQRRRDLADIETGEIVSVVEKTVINYGEEPYKKVYRSFFEKCFEYSDSIRTKVLFFILKSLKYKSSCFVGTPEKIASEIGCSRSAVFTAIKEMEKADFARRFQNGVWYINPMFLSDVDEVARYKLLQTYNNLPQTDSGRKENEDGFCKHDRKD